MAKIVITIEDDPGVEDDVTIKLDCDPPLPVDPAKLTAAQATAIIAMNAVTEDEDTEVNSAVVSTKEFGDVTLTRED